MITATAHWCRGLLAQTPNNGIGITGAAWDVSLMPVKALDSTGSGSSSNVSQAIVWAADNGADIINMSLGGLGFGHDTTLANAISYAYRKNVLLIFGGWKRCCSNRR